MLLLVPGARLLGPRARSLVMCWSWHEAEASAIPSAGLLRSATIPFAVRAAAGPVERLAAGGPLARMLANAGVNRLASLPLAIGGASAVLLSP